MIPYIAPEPTTPGLILCKEAPTKKLVLAEKPSFAQSLARALGANKRCDGYLEDNGCIIS